MFMLIINTKAKQPSQNTSEVWNVKLVCWVGLFCLSYVDSIRLVAGLAFVYMHELWVIYT